MKNAVFAILLILVAVLVVTVEAAPKSTAPMNGGNWTVEAAGEAFVMYNSRTGESYVLEKNGRSWRELIYPKQVTGGTEFLMNPLGARDK